MDGQKGRNSKLYKIDFKDRYNTIGTVFLLVFLVICARFAWVHFAHGEELLSRWEKITKEKPFQILPRRGTLYAADDRPLAITLPLYTLYLHPEDIKLDVIYNPDKFPKSIQKLPKEAQRAYQDSLMKELDKDIVALIDLCAERFGKEGSKVRFHRDAMLKKARKAFKERGEHFRLVHKISEADYQELFSTPPLAELTADGKVKGRSLLGKTVSIGVYSDRKHPFGQLALRTIGSIDNESRARNGLERAFDSELAGTVGRSAIRYGRMGKYSEVIEPVRDGSDVYTNLDMAVQDRLYTYLYDQLDSLGASRGTAAIMEVKTGKIIAQANLSKMKDGSYMDNESLLYTDLSEPGSTFKVASILALLDDGYVTDSTKVDVGNGVWQIKESRRPMRDHNAHRGGYGVISMSQVIEYSSNIGIAKMVHKYYEKNPNVFLDKVRGFGYGLDLKLDTEGVAKARIKTANGDDWWGTSLRWIAHGYETSIPPIYTLAFFSAIANDGKLMRPYLVRKIQEAGGGETHEREPEVILDQIAKPEAIRQVQGMLRRVVTKGTGAPMRSNVVSISGKTGTAVLSGPGRRYQLSFCGYFPSEAPEYAGIVVIRDPKKMAIASAGAVTAPVFRKVAEYIVSQRTPITLDSIKPARGEQFELPPVYGQKQLLASLAQAHRLPYQPDTAVIPSRFVRMDKGAETALAPVVRGVVPSVVGMSATDAHYLLLQAGLAPTFVGTGRAVGQSIAPGKKVEAGTAITIQLHKK